MEVVVGTVSGLVVGLALGWFGHVLAVRRSRGDRAIADATEALDRAAEIVAARVKYVLAYHRRLHNVAAIKEDYLDTKRRYRWADPEVFLAGTPEWQEYHAAERAALNDKATPIAERIKRVEVTSYTLLDAIGKRRTEARKAGEGRR